ncbi:MFS transporter [Catellatospora tritici]|uniref:MFS transporter n=1 Tax=Catellatospora tritici TaxID=2851566 RepID=UPI001C2D96AC|nr:MFS transporter [Catellatospora tritici]MBV1850609.1 MFS transporter [Catellatospora tritici]
MSITATTSPGAAPRRLLPAPGPARVLVLLSLLGSLGLGLYQAGSAVYFVRFVGLTTAQVGLGLGAAGLVGLVGGVAIGGLADRVGARRVACTAAFAKAVPLLYATQISGFGGFLTVVTMLGLAESAWVVANDALVAHTMAGTSRVRVSAQLRSVFNIGLTLGGLGAGVALSVGTRAAYLALVGAYVVTSLAEGLVCLRMPADRPRPPTVPHVRTGRALRDVPYLAVACHSNLTTLGDIILTIGIPLWIVTATRAPAATAAVLIALNSVLVVFLQVWATAGVRSTATAARVQTRALGTFMLCCTLIGLAATVTRGPAIALLTAGALALTAGEMWGQAARWELRYGLAAPEAQAEYGATFRLGLILPRSVGPLLVTAAIGAGVLGWLLLAALFGLGIAVNRALVDWAVRTRPQEGTA